MTTASVKPTHQQVRPHIGPRAGRCESRSGGEPVQYCRKPDKTLRTAQLRLVTDGPEAADTKPSSSIERPTDRRARSRPTAGQWMTCRPTRRAITSAQCGQPRNACWADCRRRVIAKYPRRKPRKMPQRLRSGPKTDCLVPTVRRSNPLTAACESRTSAGVRSLLLRRSRPTWHRQWRRDQRARRCLARPPSFATGDRCQRVSRRSR